MLDKNKIGTEFTPYTFDVEKGRIKFFAQAIGEKNPIHFNEDAAKDAGYKTIVAPPTFPFVLDLEGPEFLPAIKLFNLDIGRVLHGSQEFEYSGHIYAGDTIQVASKVVDIFDKKGGALESIVFQNTYTNQNQEVVAKATNSLIYRNG